MTSPAPEDRIYDKLVGLSTRVDIMLAKLDGVLKDVQDHEGRLRQLEQSRWPIANVTVLVGILALVVAVLVAAFKR